MRPLLFAGASALAMGLIGCSSQVVDLSVWLGIPTDEVVKQTDFGHKIVCVASDGGVEPPRDRIQFQRGKTRTVKIVVRNRPPKFGTSYGGKVQLKIEPPPGIIVRPESLQVDLTKDAGAVGQCTGGAHCEVSLEIAADAPAGELKITVSPTQHEAAPRTAVFKFTVR